MPSPREIDLRTGRAIADWNLTYGSILNEVTQACGRLSKACETGATAPSADSYADVRAAGSNLAAIAVRALTDPAAGVPDFDEPRRRGLQRYRAAGELTLGVQMSEEGHAWAEEAAALLSQGTQLTAQATNFTAGLAQRLTQN